MDVKLVLEIVIAVLIPLAGWFLKANNDKIKLELMDKIEIQGNRFMMNINELRNELNVKHIENIRELAALRTTDQVINTRLEGLYTQFVELKHDTE